MAADGWMVDGWMVDGWMVGGWMAGGGETTKIELNMEEGIIKDFRSNLAPYKPARRW